MPKNIGNVLNNYRKRSKMEPEGNPKVNKKQDIRGDGVGGVTLIMFPARLVRLKVDDSGEILFNFFRHFPDINFCMDFVDFWSPSGFIFDIFL